MANRPKKATPSADQAPTLTADGALAHEQTSPAPVIGYPAVNKVLLLDLGCECIDCTIERQLAWEAAASNLTMPEWQVQSRRLALRRKYFATYNVLGYLSAYQIAGLIDEVERWSALRLRLQAIGKRRGTPIHCEAFWQLVDEHMHLHDEDNPVPVTREENDAYAEFLALSPRPTLH